MDLLTRILGDRPPPFALLRRDGRPYVEILTGPVTTVAAIGEIPDGDTLALVPFRQVAELGYTHHDDGAPLRCLAVAERAELPVEEFLRTVPDADVHVEPDGFDVDDETYAAIVKRVITDEIGRGEGANFVIRRDFRATIAGYSPATAVTLFRRLLAAETGAYWTFAVHTGDATLVGATPERHVSAERGTVRMNPISGTYRYPPDGPSLGGVLAFLADSKETEELYMVVDEELKMMADVCDLGGEVHGPYLKEMGHLAHTEYVLRGRTRLSTREVLRRTMFAATVTGSPVPNACQIIAQYEPTGRGYYGAALALFGRDSGGEPTLDSPILIRTAYIDPAGRLTLPVGATLVRHSDPDGEVAETHTKAAGVLAALGIPSAGAAPETAGQVRPASLAADPRVRRALAGRNRDLSAFWLRPQAISAPAGPRALVVEAGDGWAAMLAHLLRTLGIGADVRPWHDLPELSGYGLVVPGPGPGDPRELAVPKMAALDGLVADLLARGIPLLAVCLGHQVLCGRLGLGLIAKDEPFQGTQREIGLFGRSEKVGFYNTFAAQAPVKRIPGIDVSADPGTGEVHAVRGRRFAGVQFHAESILTSNGPAIVRRLLDDLLP